MANKPVLPSRGSVFSPRINWPHVIDLSSHVDKNGNQDTLRFPPFHQEILEQRHWDAGDLHGRIRVVIAEGFARPHRNPPFERVKEIIAFAFQHAPLNVLEYSSIAWPNTSMWSKEPRLFKYNAGSGVNDLKEAEETHAHSPAARPDEIRPPAPVTGQIGNPSALTLWRNRNYQGPVPQWQGNYRDPRWAAPETVFSDPFIDPYVLDPAARHRGARHSWEDISMPDYVSSSSSSRAISSMTGISYEHSKHPSLVAPIGEEAYSQLIQALSPTKQVASSTQAPTTTSTAAAVPMGAKLSAAAEARSASYRKGGNNRASTSILEDISCSSSRDASGSSAKSNTALPEIAAERGVATKLHASPSGPVKSRKEGISVENKENEAEKTRRESDKARQTPSKLNVRTIGGIETPTDGRKRRSLSSSRDDGLLINRKEPVLVSPSQDLTRVKDKQDRFDSFLDPRPTLVTADVGEIE
ncbi:uncharacterized protein DSM5745_10752 [Aspergillus mulundensis]|uniref:Uncharacterized protein n=1 Tax=Aspergillus mulundensis TaxID=1810919 RepID=A0A3D8QIK1_9EURO|nr:Uncharacterized protein DSM5745_10752 [Aspergillus mulundensis]RDW61254.1 Uncharacterized protein DSM5745_10752 [Aspergillus mulundensis]